MPASLPRGRYLRCPVAEETSRLQQAQELSVSVTSQPAMMSLVVCVERVVVNGAVVANETCMGWIVIEKDTGTKPCLYLAWGVAESGGHSERQDTVGVREDHHQKHDSTTRHQSARCTRCESLRHPATDRK